MCVTKLLVITGYVPEDQLQHYLMSRGLFPHKQHHRLNTANPKSPHVSRKPTQFPSRQCDRSEGSASVRHTLSLALDES